MRNLKRSIAAALATAMVLSSIGIGSAEARSRHHHRGNAAAVGAMLGVFGTIAALAAADNYRDSYYDNGYGYRYRGQAYRGYAYRGRPYRGSQFRVPPQYRNNPAAYPIRNGLMPNNLPVGNDPLNADPYGR